MAERNETTLKDSFKLLDQLRNQVSSESRPLLDQVASKLRLIESSNQKFVDDIDYRKEDEKSFLESQDALRQVHDNSARELQQ